MIKSSARDLPGWSERYLHIPRGTAETCGSFIYLCNNCSQKQTLYIQIVGASLTAAETDRKLLGVYPLPLRIKLASSHAVAWEANLGRDVDEVDPFYLCHPQYSSQPEQKVPQIPRAMRSCPCCCFPQSFPFPSTTEEFVGA